LFSHYYDDAMRLLLYRDHFCYNGTTDSSWPPKNSMTSAQLNRTHAGVPLSVAAFRSWLAGAKPGERFEYHRGYLALDRVKGTTSLKEAEHRKLAALADHALALAGQGRVHLLQERHGDGDYSYWALARAPSASGFARMRLPGAAAHDKFAIADAPDPPAGAPHHPDLSMAAHLVEREEVAQ
jgi:uncharacterized protein (DUF2237 family)